ncbi:oligopeptide binding protein, putative [Conexivisphaera calida]|uniref:Oligopeptide binding protein, putative n=2 Tax=Conexivisphaera calida TaxID=1874277 RepID=A0A4P2VE72_9ARCH|nr:oligopeptide binding protein, putative [Conexivisphaera calida]
MEHKFVRALGEWFIKKYDHIHRSNMRRALPLIVALILMMSFLPEAMPAMAQSSPQYSIPQQTILQPSQVRTHGPLVNTVVFNVYTSDHAAFLALSEGQIQAMEWTLSPSDYVTAETNPNLYTGSTPTYAFDGIAFNMLMYPYNNTHFRRAIAYLTNYAEIQSVIGPSVYAGPQLYPQLIYPSLYNSSIKYPYSYNPQMAIKELEEVPGMAYNPTTGQWTLYGKPFSPVLYYRSDDPLRAESAQLLQQAAAEINLTITLKPVTGVTASSVIYSPSDEVVISPGIMLANYSNIPPVYNWTLASQSDTWGMYTVGWIVSWEPTWSYYFYNSQLAGTSNFINFYNSSMDYWTNIFNWVVNNQSQVEEACSNIQVIFNQQLPYIMWFYESNLYAVQTNGWQGYANIPSTGPSETTGLYYTLLNVHPTGTVGGTFTEALHSAPTSLDPLYYTIWVWQEDVWQEVYDSPIGTPPWGVTNGSLMPWMATYNIQSDVTAPIGNGSGWWNPFGASGIVNGQVVTINFFRNATWQDGLPVTAYDYNFSLYYWNVQGVTGASTALAYYSTPPYGLLATYIPPNNPYEIELYVNSTNIWNIYSIIVPVLPEHIFQYFDPNTVATSTSAMDTTVPLSQISGLSSYLNSPNETLPQWMYWLPNLEVGTGPFVFQSWNKVTNTQVLTRNVNYYRSAWWAWMSTVTQGSSYSYKVNVNEEIYNPTSSSFEGVAPGSTGYIPITNATGVVQVEAPGGTIVASYPLTSVGNGSYTASISTSSLSPGTYELVANLTYTSFGLNRVWYSYSGLTVSAPVTSAPLVITVLNPSGLPIAGATVTVDGMSATTNSSGMASFSSVPLGSYTATISAPGYQSTNITVSVSAPSATASASLTPVPTKAPTPSYTALYAIIAVIVIVVIVAVVVIALRRR